MIEKNQKMCILKRKTKESADFFVFLFARHGKNLMRSKTGNLSESGLRVLLAYGRTVWNLSLEEEDMAVAEKAIDKTSEFFASIGMPKKLSELGIDDTYFEAMAERAEGFCEGCYVPLQKEDIEKIYRNAL